MATDRSIDGPPRPIAQLRGTRRSGRNRKQLVRILKNTIIYAIMSFAGLLCLGPFIWMVLSSFKDSSTIFNIPPDWLPANPTTISYWNAWNNYPNGAGMFGQWYANTVVLALAWTVANVLFCSLAGYTFARIRFAGRDKIFMGYLGTLMIPPIVTIIPQYIMVSKLGWVDTYQGILFPGLLGNVYGTFLMRQFFSSLPVELDESARIDGAGRLRIFFQIAVPLSMPGVATLAVITFVNSWNNFLWPLLVTNSEGMKMITVGLQDFFGQSNTNWADVMAGSTLAVSPLIVLFFLMQRFIVQGIQFTGLK
jgi:multiple sugar transport system permease protein